MGKTPARNNSAYWQSGKYKWVSIADLGSYKKYTENTKEKITKLAVSDTGIKPVPANTVIMSFKLSLGKTAITKEDIFTNEAIMAFIPNGNFSIIPDYFYHLFSGMDWAKETKRAVMGATLNKETLSKISIFVPPLEEQEKIAMVLDKVSELIEKREQQLAKLDELIKSRFVEMFGTFPINEKNWTVGKIRDVITEVKYGTSRPAVENGQYPYLRMNNITYSGELDLSDIKQIDIPENELPKCTVRRGDVLFNRTNSKELVGKTCVYDKDELMVLAGFIIRVRVNEKMLPEFLSDFLNASFSKQMLLGMCKTAIGQANINAQELQNIEIYIPPIDLQKEFVIFKQNVIKAKITINHSLNKLETLKKALMQKYFN